MSYEETLICDGCSKVIDGGTRRSTTRTLVDQGGRAFSRGRREQIVEDPVDQASRSFRHLCGDCAGSRRTFFDGTPIPEAAHA